MGKLTVFNFMTLNGYYKGAGGDLSWHPHDKEEEHAYGIEGVQSGNTLLFGRITYEMMAGYWPSPDAIKNDSLMANGMNQADKIVFSRTLDKPAWNNTRLIKEDMAGEVKKMKELPGKDMTILGSGTIVSQLAGGGLIDEYLFMLDPVALGDGTPVLKGVSGRINLTLVSTKTFKSGALLLCYQPVKN